MKEWKDENCYLFRGRANLTGISNRCDLTSTAAQCSDNLFAGTNVSLFKEKSPLACLSRACNVRPTHLNDTQSMCRESFESLTRKTLSCCPASSSSASLEVTLPQYQPCLEKVRFMFIWQGLGKHSAILL